MKSFKVLFIGGIGSFVGAIICIIVSFACHTDIVGGANVAIMKSYGDVQGLQRYEEAMRMNDFAESLIFIGIALAVIAVILLAAGYVMYKKNK